MIHACVLCLFDDGDDVSLSHALCLQSVDRFTAALLRYPSRRPDDKDESRKFLSFRKKTFFFFFLHPIFEVIVLTNRPLSRRCRCVLLLLFFFHRTGRGTAVRGRERVEHDFRALSERSRLNTTFINTRFFFSFHHVLWTTAANAIYYVR